MKSRPKFKIWDIKEKKWYTPTFEAYKGRLHDLLLSSKGDLLAQTIRGLEHESLWPDRYDVVLFTGLLDKNGCEIYEGDIISRLRHSEASNWASPMIHKKEFARIVKFEQGMFVGDDNSCPLKNDVRHGSNIMPDYEVIGNIYENSEFLIN